METVLAFFAGVMFNWWFLGISLFFSSWCDYVEKRAVAVILMLFAAFAAFYVLDWSFEGPWWAYVGGYVVTGVVWSIWRYNRYCAKVVAEYENHSRKDEQAARYTKELLEVSGNVPMLAYWVIAWPISVVGQSFGDIFMITERLVKAIASVTYEKISASAVKRVEALTLTNDGDAKK